MLYVQSLIIAKSPVDDGDCQWVLYWATVAYYINEFDIKHHRNDTLAVPQGHPVHRCLPRYYTDANCCATRVRSGSAILNFVHCGFDWAHSLSTLAATLADDMQTTNSYTAVVDQATLWHWPTGSLAALTSWPARCLQIGYAWTPTRPKRSGSRRQLRRQYHFLFYRCWSTAR